ncbi:MAG: hypothetical protein WC489_07965 [Patescibacteria group bacterium]
MTTTTFTGATQRHRNRTFGCEAYKDIPYSFSAGYDRLFRDAA